MLLRVRVCRFGTRSCLCRREPAQAKENEIQEEENASDLQALKFEMFKRAI